MKLWVKALVAMILGLSVSLIGCAKPKEQESCGFVQNVYQQRVSWKGNVPVQLYVHESFPKEFIPSLERAIRTWESRAGRRLFEIASTGYRGNSVPQADGKNVLYFMNSWEPEKEKAGQQARTSIYWVSDTINEADIRFNAKSFNLFDQTFTLQAQSNPPRGNVHAESVILHELGHVLGLKHNDSEANPSVMNTYLSSGEIRTEPSQEDSSSLSCEY